MKLVKTFLSAQPNPWSMIWVSAALLWMFILTWCSWQGVIDGDLFTASREQIYQAHEYWRLFTTTAIHADAVHFMSNALFFWIFGYFLNGYFGAWIFPTLCIFAGASINAATLYFYPPESVLVGASGVVYFMAAFWVSLFFFIERGKSWLNRLLVSVGVSLALFFPSTFEPYVSYLAHAIGFTLGILLGSSYFLLQHQRLREAEVWQFPEPDAEPDAEPNAEPEIEVQEHEFIET